MERKSVLLGVAVVLAGYSAFAHLGVGLAEVLGSVPDGSLTVVPMLFILSAVVVGLFLISLARGVALPTIYLVGGVLMVLHLVAYVDVHATGYFETATGVDMHGHGHEGGHGHDGSHTHDASQSHESGHTHDDSSGHEHNDDSNDHGADGHTHGDGEAGHTHDDGTENHSHDGSSSNHTHDDDAAGGHSHADSGSSTHTHENGADGHTHADGGDEHTHSGDESAGQVLVSHLRDDLTALSTKIAETGSAIAFFALYVLER
ncbi:hypothetical protein HALLA_15185 [Halostagnicola larsenii XH-48]|uniref:Uncharacterized protein n=1 Tax=Halostagnicola larsenii XH-48 TaxID=797299 RepID=W0JVI1_9EURY|nr:hypothetical protein [Halostagnicola larsenii]AHG01068.1 hypothetical protein HALLA_15185 [Halostagnicola larsenii XH-48]